MVFLNCVILPAFSGPAADPKLVAKNPRVSNKADTGVMLADVRPEKLFYRQGESLKAVITLSNPSREARPVRVRAWLEQGMDATVGLQTQDVTLAPTQTQAVALTWPAADLAMYGQALGVELLGSDGTVIASGRDYFSSADTVWKVAIGATPNGPASSSANYKDEQIVAQVGQFRDQYCNVWEKYFWALDDWGLMTNPPGATWFSGQARRHENTEKLKLHVEASHALGITVVSYGKCMAGGTPGWELARARPQWFLTDVNGRTMGRPADVWDLDHWQEADKFKYEEFKYSWTYRWVDLRRLDTLEHGINQLVASTRQYGWDGVRYDSGGFRAHFVDGVYGGNDAVNTRNMKHTKEQLWKMFPNYLFGFNTDNTASKDGRAYPLTVGEMSHEMREMLAGGGLWMGEAIKSFANGSVQYATWSQFARDERRCAQAIREAGGHFCYLYSKSGPVRNVYQFVVGLMIGAHPYGGEHVGLPLCPDWGVFMTRWSGLLWDPALRPVADPEASITVEASRPIWCKDFVNERVLSPTRRQVIVHLLNPPVDDNLATVLKELPKDVLELAAGAAKKLGATKEDSLNAILEGEPKADEQKPQLPPEMLAAARAQQFPEPIASATVKVRVPDGQKPVAAWLVSPDQPGKVVAADWKMDSGQLVVSVPGFPLWTLVVCEFEGQFTPPASLAPFSAPLSPAELADLERKEPASTNIPWFGLRPPSPTPNVPSIERVPPVEALTPFVSTARSTSLPEGVKLGGEEGLDVLVVNGLYHAFHRVPESIAAVAPEARVTTRTTRDLPVTPETFFGYDAVVLVNMPASAWDGKGQQALVDFVQAGGRLAILGGPFTFGQGDFTGSILNIVLPVMLLPGRDIFALPKPLVMGETESKAFQDRPALYYLHAANPSPDSTVRAWAGTHPVLVEGKYGKGSVLVFLGAPLGERQGNETPFWEAKEWPRILGTMMLGR